MLENFESKYRHFLPRKQHFLPRKCLWKYHLQNDLLYKIHETSMSDQTVGTMVPLMVKYSCHVYRLAPVNIKLPPTTKISQTRQGVHPHPGSNGIESSPLHKVENKISNTVMASCYNMKNRCCGGSFCLCKWLLLKVLDEKFCICLVDKLLLLQLR